MNQRAPRNTQVTPDDLENRENQTTAAPDDVSEFAKVQGELAALKARIEAARQVMPLPAERHCLDCFQKGRNAAIRAMVGAT